MIEDLWQHVRVPGSFRRVSENHPLDLYVGQTTDQERALLLRIDHKPADPPTMQKVRATRHQLADGRWNLMLAVINPTDNPLFNALCADLVESTKDADSKTPADELVLARLARWRKLLQGKPEGLTVSELRGLYAELLLLEQILLPRLGPLAVAAWSGPLGSPQDFELGSASWEVKAVHSSSTSVIINSLEQLAAPGPIHLACVRLDPGQDPNSTVPALVGRLRAALEPHAAWAEAFETRMEAFGYAPQARYESHRFHFNGVSWYEVRDGFPRLTPDTVPSGVTEVRYALALGELQEFAEEEPHADERP